MKEILYADYTFLNQPLAKFYGIETDVQVDGRRWRRSTAPSAFNRGGVLRLGAVLTTTSAPLRTSPVKRGDWVLRRILGTPTPPPPADAGTLPADDKTLRRPDAAASGWPQHKRNATCADCHLRIDPLGFPLEGFDAVGRGAHDLRRRQAGRRHRRVRRQDDDRRRRRPARATCRRRTRR